MGAEVETGAIADSGSLASSATIGGTKAVASGVAANCRRQLRHAPATATLNRGDNLNAIHGHVTILRELQCLIEFDKEPWAELMRDTLRAANIAVHEAREAGAMALEPKVIAAFVDQYWAAIRLGLAFHRQLPGLQAKANASGRTKQRPGRNLLERLKTFKVETLRFLTDFDVPFTNNLAEQDLRMMKVKMKISGSFRTLDGAQTFARVRSVVSTARKQGANILKTLADPPTHFARALNA